LERNYYNLLLADLMLRDGSGMQIAEEAHRHPYHHRDRFRRADLARFDLLLKPVQPAELLEAVPKC
jgi:DNA-binding response OmpR family regulator